MIGNTADHIIASITGQAWMGKDTGGRGRPTHSEIAQLAYYLWEENGRQDGCDLKDWLLAERQLIHHYA
jgi:hypothetical protein